MILCVPQRNTDTKIYWNILIIDIYSHRHQYHKTKAFPYSNYLKFLDKVY